MISVAKSLVDFVNNKTIEYFSSEYHSYDISKNFGAIYSGSFNPLHHGHLEIAAHTENIKNLSIVFEVCITRFDKPELTLDEIYKIKAQFDGLLRPIIFTRLPTFLSKTKLGMGLSFIIGADTLIRLNNSKYYFESDVEKERVFTKLKKRRTTFIVYEREGYSPHSEWATPLHPTLKELCIFTGHCPKAISSTELRSKIKESTK